MFRLEIFSVLFWLISKGISAPIDSCLLTQTVINDETWEPFVKKLVACIERAVALKDKDRFNFFISLAEDLSEVSYKHADQNMLPFIIPSEIEKDLSKVIIRHIGKDEAVIKEGNEISIIDVFGVNRTRKLNLYNVMILISLSGILILSAVLALTEIFVSWKKYTRGKKSRRVLIKRVIQPRIKVTEHGDGFL